MPALLRRKMLLPSQYTLSAVRKQRDLQMEKAVRGTISPHSIAIFISGRNYLLRHKKAASSTWLLAGKTGGSKCVIIE